MLLELTEVINWFELGVQLGIPVHTLLEIRVDCRLTRECRMQMLIKWGEIEKCTWLKLIKALIKIDHRKLASRIAQEHPGMRLILTNV